MRTCSRQLRPAGTYYAARFSVSEEELLIQLCGTEDFLYEHNRRFRLAAEEAGYGHCYGKGPGEHAWPYCSVSSSDWRRTENSIKESYYEF